MPISMPSDYTLCRMFRAHALEDFTPGPDYKAPDWGITLHFRCVRCSTERHDTIDTRGELSSRRYVYPGDYRLAADDRPTTGELRLLYVSTLATHRRERNQQKGTG